MKPVFLLFIAFMAGAAGLAAPTKENPRRAQANAAASPAPRKVNKQGDLASNLELLKQWVPPSEAALRLYTAAYKILAAAPGATFLDVGRDPEIQRICRDHGIVHLGGPMLGALTENSVNVWLRTLQPGAVEVRVTIAGVEKTFGPVFSTAATDLAAVVPVSGLQPATRYPYRILVDGQAVALPENAAITTAPESGLPGQVRISFGSCYHRWGLGNPRQAELMRRRGPAAFLAIGDIAVQDRNNHLGLHRADYLHRDFQPAWRGLVASVPVYAAWDDHDYFDNDKSGLPPGYTARDREGVWEVFRHSWNNPSYGFGDERRGVFLRTRIGPCDILMTDSRYFRTRPKQKDAFLGEAQMQWLEAQLLSCRGPFIIISSGTMWSDYVSNGKDSWGVWDPEGRERIFRLIEKHRIGGVLLISGDRHGARGFRLPRPSGFNFYEFEAASLGGRSGPPVTIAGAPQLYGIADQYAFGEFTIDATRPDPTVEFRLIGEAGNTFYELTLTRSQLTPPPAR